MASTWLTIKTRCFRIFEHTGSDQGWRRTSTSTVVMNCLRNYVSANPDFGLFWDLLQHKQRNEGERDAEHGHQHVAECKVRNEVIRYGLHPRRSADNKTDDSITENCYQEDADVHEVQGRLELGAEPSRLVIVRHVAANVIIQCIIAVGATVDERVINVRRVGHCLCFQARNV